MAFAVEKAEDEEKEAVESLGVPTLSKSSMDRRSSSNSPSPGTRISSDLACLSRTSSRIAFREADDDAATPPLPPF
jgi:hypothetical protein